MVTAMLRAKQIIRITILLVGLTAVLEVASAQQAPAKQGATAQPNHNLNEDSPNPHESDPALLAIEKSLQAIVGKLGPAPDADAKAAKEDKRGNADLKAQKKMAHWAKVMAWL